MGPVGKVDPEELSDEETAELREEGFALARYRDGESAELFARPIANSVRDELIDKFGEDVLSPTDDRRETEIQLSEAAPRRAEELIQLDAEDMRQEVEGGSGQINITDEERKRIDFTKTDLPTAKRAKGAIRGEGIDGSSWLDVWSEDLKTVNEARDAARKNRESIVGDRTDEEEGVDDRTTSYREAQSGLEENALKYAKNGDDDAREALIDEFGWSPDEIEAADAPVNA